MQRFNIGSFLHFWQRKKIIGSLLVCVALLFILLPFFFLWQKAPVQEVQKPVVVKEIVPAHVEGQLIVAFKKGESLTNFLKNVPVEFGFTAYTRVFPKETTSVLADYYLLKFSSKADIEAVKAYVQKQKEVRSVDYNKLMHLDVVYTPLSINDPLAANQWPLGAIDIGRAWDMLQKDPIQTGKKIMVGIIDSGIDYNHEDLNNGQVIKGGDFATNDGLRVAPGKSGDPMDVLGHGTAIAGIIGATTNNYKGIAGAAGVSGVLSLLAVKTEGSNGLISLNDSLIAIDSAITAGAKVINLSFGAFSACSSAYQQLFDAHKDVVFVVSAGNGLCQQSNGTYTDPQGGRCPTGTTKVGVDISTYSHDPASCNGVIAVASVDSSNTPAVTSNWGQKVALAAPGVGIVTTRASACPLENCGPISNPVSANYVSLNGTSFSAPYVSGAAALLLAKYPTLTPAQVKECLVKSGESTVHIKPNQPVGPLLNIGKALSDCPVILAGSGITPTPVLSVATISPTVAVKGISDKLICVPEGGMVSRFHSNILHITNNKGKEVKISYQSFLCPYKGVTLKDGDHCDDYKGSKIDTIPAGATKTYTLDLPSCTIGQLDVKVVDAIDGGCYQPDGKTPWDGGLGFVLQANSTGYASGSCGSNIIPNAANVKIALDSLGATGNIDCVNNGNGIQMCTFNPSH